MSNILDICFFLLFVKEVQNENNGLTYSEIFICTIGSSVFIECKACNTASKQWTYKSINGGNAMEDLGKGSDKIRNKLDEKGVPRYNFSTNDSNCTYNLFITGIQSGDAGTFTCWEGSVALKTIFVVAIEKTVNCSSELEFPHSKNLILKQNDPVTNFKCYFQYSAGESCIVTPIWTDFTGYRNFNIPLYGIEVNADNKHACIKFKPGADITNGTRLNLSLSFNCSLNNSQNHPIGRYDFGLLPFIFYVEGKTGSDHGSQKTNQPFKTITIIGIAITAIALVLSIAWIFIKLYREARNIPTGDIPCPFEMKDFTVNGGPEFQTPEDGTYDFIDDYEHNDSKLM